MKHIIKQLIKETKNSRCVDVVSSKESTGVCTTFNGKLKQVCLGLHKYKSELHKDSGLGMMKIIDDETEPHKTNIPQGVIDDFLRGLRLIYKTKKFNKDLLNRYYTIVRDKKLVYDEEGNWSSVNKLNTNYSDLAELLTCFLYDTKIEELNTILDMINNGEDVIGYIKPMMVDFKNYFSLDDLKKFTKNTKHLSSVGDVSEQLAKEFLEEKGLNVSYSGGDGDFIDMVFGVDMIVEEDGLTKLVQVKNSEKAVFGIKKHIDWLIVSNKFGIGVFSKRGNILNYKGTKLCKGYLCYKKIKW